MDPIQLEPGAVHVWEADLEAVPGALAELLSPEERARSQAILPPRPRLLWPRSRALLRVLLGRYTGIAPEALVLDTGPRGKPLLRGERHLHFNLSHSGGLALYAFGAGCAVGVDVELAGRRSTAFLRDWTRREAIAKCVGTGLGAALPAPGVARVPRALASSGAIRPSQPQLWVEQLELNGGALAAIACEQKPLRIERRRWPDQAELSLPGPSARRSARGSR